MGGQNTGAPVGGPGGGISPFGPMRPPPQFMPQLQPGQQTVPQAPVTPGMTNNPPAGAPPAAAPQMPQGAPNYAQMLQGFGGRMPGIGGPVPQAPPGFVGAAGAPSGANQALQGMFGRR